MDSMVKDIINAALSGGKETFAQPVPDIPRPNYQREQSQRRLLTFDLSGGAQTVCPPQVPPVADDTALRMVRLSGEPSVGIGPSKKPFSQVNTNQGIRGGASVIYELIEHADARTLRLTGLNSPPGSTVGLAFCEVATLAQLFAADKAAAQLPALAVTLHWNEEADPTFFFRCAGRKGEVEQALSIIKEQLSGGKAVCSTNSSDIIIRRRLKITSGFVAGIDGLPMVSLLPKVDGYYKQNPESTLEFTMGRGYLLVRGQEQEALQALEQLNQCGLKGEW